MAWVVFLVVALPLVGFLVWLLLASSFTRVEPGKLGLLLVRGRATDTALLPGAHFVPAFRRRMVEVYPSNELSYRAGDIEVGESSEGGLERGGPRLQVMLGDRAMLELGFTVRFRVVAEQLRSVHDRFSAEGLWAAVRDQSSRTIRAHLSQPRLGVDDLFGAARPVLEAELAAVVTAALATDGFEVTMFSLGDVDLGRTGEVIQQTVRARHELEREQAEAAIRLAQVRMDAELEPYLAAVSVDGALRSREVDVWRELAQGQQYRGNVAIPTSSRAASGSGVATGVDPDGGSESIEP
jgi:regulator of protease activity HflC (stomatin/prohibitin superfamily)